MRKIFLMAVCMTFIILLMAGCDNGAGTESTVSCDHNYVATAIKHPTYESEGEETYVCDQCGDAYSVRLEKLEKHVVPKTVLDQALSNVKYQSGPFSIYLGNLVNRTIGNYKIKYLSGEEAIAKGYIKKSDMDSSVNIDNLYYAIVSGDAMLNPEIPYMTEYEAEAIKVWMIFDENDQLLNSGVTLCKNLQSCAIIIMSRGY